MTLIFQFTNGNQARGENFAEGLGFPSYFRSFRPQIQSPDPSNQVVHGSFWAKEAQHIARLRPSSSFYRNHHLEKISLGVDFSPIANCNQIEPLIFQVIYFKDLLATYLSMRIFFDLI